jgi:glycerol-3-phosphate dehydrogenase subunit C
MPMLLEGNLDRAADSVRRNLDILLDAVADGYDPVCSCPTCGFLMKVLLREGACFSPAYQESVHAAAGEIRMPGRMIGKPGFVSLKKSLYPKILKDDGLFSHLDPLARLALANRVLDAGEYLHWLYRENRLNACLGQNPSRMAYFAPCHQREQDIGSPYETLLRLIPGLQVVKTGGAMDCCGMGGHMGFTEGFSKHSISIGRSLFQKIREVEPEGVITECLSCRMQLEHVLPYPVFHPLEVLGRSYREADVE